MTRSDRDWGAIHSLFARPAAAVVTTHINPDGDALGSELALHAFLSARGFDVRIVNAGVVEKLVVYPENMKKNLDRLGGLVHSQRVLLALTQGGISREDAYRIVQTHAMKVWRGEGDFLAFLKADPEVTKSVPIKDLEASFDLGYHLKHVDTIFRRVFGAA